MSGSNSKQTAPGEQTDDGVVATGRDRATSWLETRHLGTVGLVVGGALVVRALRAKTRGRRVVGVLAGSVLVGLGIRQRLAPPGNDRDGHGKGGAGRSTATETDTATRTAHAVEEVDNPRDVTEDPDVRTETDPDAGSVRFTTDHESGPRTESTLDEAAQTDPREDDSEGSVTVDLSEPAMADEPNEATGPDPEQAQPASTEATEPDPGPTADESDGQGDGQAAEDGRGDEDVGQTEESDDEASEDETDGGDTAGDA